MVVALWVVQILLGLMFGLAGVLKMSKSKEELAPRMPYVEDFSPGIIRFIGALELLAAIGLVVPLLVGIAPGLTAWAAVGLVLVMIGAALTHLRRKEPQAIGMNLVLLALAAFVALGRFGVFS